MWTGSREVGELKLDQIRLQGRDESIANCEGPMSAEIRDE